MYLDMKCSLLWCQEDREVNYDGTVMGFCSRNHYEESLCKLKGCKNPRTPKNSKELHFFCCAEHSYQSRGEWKSGKDSGRSHDRQDNGRFERNSRKYKDRDRDKQLEGNIRRRKGRGHKQEEICHMDISKDCALERTINM